MTMRNELSKARKISLQAAILLGAFLLPMGCSMKVLKPTSDDTVRERIAAVEKKNRELELENEGLKAHLAEAQKDLTKEEAELSAATPQLTSMQISSTSVIETDPSGQRELLLRLAPSDDRGRFMQVVGSLNVRVVAVPATGDPIPLAVAQFDPTEVREAWRGGIMGSGYLFEIPINRDANTELPPTVDVVTHFTDVRSGLDLRDERPVRIVDRR